MGVRPLWMAKGSIMAPTSATEGDGHKNKENSNITPPKIHQVTEGVHMTRDKGFIIK